MPESANAVLRIVHAVHGTAAVNIVETLRLQSDLCDEMIAVTTHIDLRRVRVLCKEMHAFGVLVAREKAWCFDQEAAARACSRALSSVLEQLPQQADGEAVVCKSCRRRVKLQDCFSSLLADVLPACCGVEMVSEEDNSALRAFVLGLADTLKSR
jgi:transcription initiation factor IIE alpha subunit